MSDDDREFYRNGRWVVGVAVLDGGGVRFRLRKVGELFSCVQPIYGHIHPTPKWVRWLTPSPWYPVDEAARRAIARADKWERETQQAEFQTEQAGHAVAAILEQQTALASLERELAR